MPTLEEGVPLYSANDGVLIFEAENFLAEGEWSEINIDGEVAMLWDNDRSNYNRVDPDEELKAAFTVDKSGTFHFAHHAGRVRDVMNNSDLRDGEGNLRGDTGNDAYFAVKNLETGEYVKDPTKFFVGLGQADEKLRWGDTFENHELGFHAARVELEEDTLYQLEITGRSDGYALDRVTLNYGIHDLNDADVPESEFVLNASVVGDPGADAAPADTSEADTGDGGSMMAALGLGLSAGLFFVAGPLGAAVGAALAVLVGGGGSDSGEAASTPAADDTTSATLSEIVPITEVISDDDVPSDAEEDEEVLDLA
ncbi:MAG: hypothetical protein AAF871_11445 [Pseudomonadota bacterium]